MTRPRFYNHTKELSRREARRRKDSILVWLEEENPSRCPGLLLFGNLLLQPRILLVH
jgi:hypothetical protein